MTRFGGGVVAELKAICVVSAALLAPHRRGEDYGIPNLVGGRIGDSVCIT